MELCQVTVQIVILAMIAAFLGLRLYSVLGRRAEHEEETIDGRIDAKQGVSPLAPAAAADRRFDAFMFVDGARAAYGMILEAFWRGDKEELAQLADGDVYQAFCAAIDARVAAGETLDNRLVRIDDAVLVGASFDAPIARITVRFTADIAAVTRDAQGNVIAGSLDDAVQAVDIWTFSRNLRSAEPDWLLDETDEG